MFFFGNRKLHRTRKQAEHLLHLAHKVIAYRSDVAKPETIQEIEKLADALRLKLKDSNSLSVEVLEDSMTTLDKPMREAGGKIYPVTQVAENVELFLVAAILAIGIRTFFFQPFKIPTNSMYPTYGGVVAEVYADDEPGPSLPERMLKKVLYFSSYHEILAPASGKIEIRVEPQFELKRAFQTLGQQPKRRILGYRMSEPEKVPGSLFGLGIIPRQNHAHRLYVGGREVFLELPPHVDEEELLRMRFFPEAKRFEDGLAKAKQRVTSNGEIYVDTGVQVEEGDRVLGFELITGDMLFVDRFSYHFVKPDIGAPLVFRTDVIEGIPEDQYYIKRLVGMPGDRLEVENHALLRNGEPITGASAFDQNAKLEGDYGGYCSMTHQQVAMPGGLSYKTYYQATGSVRDANPIAPKSYYAMGDNSYHSSDSRIFGVVPEQAVVGRALFIFYPFTKRWGPAE